MRPPIFSQADLEAIRAARVTTTDSCATCGQDIAPGTLYGRDAEGKPVHIGPCPASGRFTDARRRP